MKEKSVRVLRSIAKIALLLCGVFLLLLGCYYTYKSIRFRPYKVRVSNVTDSAFTVSWVTDEPMVGVVYYGEKDSFLPGPLSWLGKKKALDDRDVADAQTECVSKFNKKVSKTRDENFTVDASGYDCHNVKVFKKGHYYTHHVTVGNLEAEKEYFFRVGNGYISYAHSNFEGVGFVERELPVALVFSQWTLPTITDVATPTPAYGTSYNVYYRDDGSMAEKKNFDSITFLQAHKGDDVYPLMSSVNNNKGGWSIELSNIRDSENKVVPMKGVSLEFMPQVENARPGATGYSLYEETEFPLKLMGNNIDDLKKDVEEKIESTVFEKIFKTSLAQESSSLPTTTTPPTTRQDELIPGCATPKKYLRDGGIVRGYCSGNNNQCYRQWFVASTGELCVNQPLTGEVCGNVACGDSAEKTVITDGVCTNGYGCICHGRNIGLRDECKPEEQSVGGNNNSGEVQNGSNACPSPSFPEFIKLGGKEFCVQQGKGQSYKSAYDSHCSDSSHVSFTILAREKNMSNTQNYQISCPKPARVSITAVDMGAQCSDLSNGCICDAGDSYKYNFGLSSEPDKCYSVKDIGNGEDCPQERICKCIDKQNIILPETKERKCGSVETESKYCWKKGKKITGEGLSCVETNLAREYNECDNAMGYYDSETECITKGLKDGGVATLCYGYATGGCQTEQNYDECYDNQGKLLEHTFLTKTECDSKLTIRKGTLGIGERCNSDHGCTCVIGSALSSVNKGSCCGGDWTYQKEKNDDYAPKGACEQKGTGRNRSPVYCSETECNAKASSVVAGLLTGRYDKIGDENVADVVFGGTTLVCMMEGADAKCEKIEYHKYNNSPDSYYPCNCAEVGTELPKYNIDNRNRLIIPSFADNNASEYLTENGLLYFPESGIYEVQTSDGKKSFFAGGTPERYYLYEERNGVDGYQSPEDSANPKENDDILVNPSAVVINVSKTIEAHEVVLKKGINIVSFNFFPTIDGVEGMNFKGFLKLVNNNGSDMVSRISYFKGSAWAGGSSYDFNTGEIQGFETELLTFGRGFLVVATRDGSIFVPGKRLDSSVPIAFSSGWNLVGVHGHSTAYTAKSFINSINSIEGIQANNVTYWPTSKGMYQGFQLSEGQEYGQDFPISKDLGYFVRINDIKKECRSIWWNPDGENNGKCN